MQPKQITKIWLALHLKTRNAIAIALMAFSVFFCSTLMAQSYFYYVNEVPTSGGGTVIYKTLLSLEVDGSATARIQYNAGTELHLYLYQLNLTDSLANIEGKGRRFLMCKTPPLPLIDKDSVNFFEPRFLFKKTSDSGVNNYQPDGVEIKNATGNWVVAKLTESKEKSFAELQEDEPFVSAFYFDSDVFYKYLFNDKLRSVISARPEKMFLITVANTNDETVGKSVAIDLKNWTILFTKIAANLGINKVISIKIYGDDYTKLGLQNALKKLETQNPASSDIIIFYYSGHGFRMPGDVSPYANISFRTPENRKKNVVGDFMPLEDVYNNLMALKTKVCMVFGDCCNADIYQNPVFGSDVNGGKGGGTLGYFNVEEAKKLFLPTMPLSLLVGSVEKGHLSIGNTSMGGYFTYFLTAALQKNLWGYYSHDPFNLASPTVATWMRILLEARQNTYRKSLSIQCGATENDRCVQKAEIKVTPQ